MIIVLARRIASWLGVPGGIVIGGVFLLRKKMKERRQAKQAVTQTQAES